jgi:hypothetical protein
MRVLPAKRVITFGSNSSETRKCFIRVLLTFNCTVCVMRLANIDMGTLSILNNAIDTNVRCGVRMFSDDISTYVANDATATYKYVIYTHTHTHTRNGALAHVSVENAFRYAILFNRSISFTRISLMIFSIDGSHAYSFNTFIPFSISFIIFSRSSL